MKPERGLSLAESVITIFILVTGFLLMVRLFHAALQYQSLVESRLLAVLIAERHVEKIRNWSLQTHGPSGTRQFVDWTGCPGVGPPSPVPDHPGFAMNVTTSARPLQDPCSLFESVYPAGERKVINESARQVLVNVTYGSGRSHVLWTLVAMPTLDPKPPGPPYAAEVTPGGSGSLAIPQDGIIQASVLAKDDKNRPLNDLMFLWTLRPESGDSGGGDGTIQAARDGRTAAISNRIYDASSPPNIVSHGPGRCLGVPTAIYRGKVIQGATGPLDMQ